MGGGSPRQKAGAPINTAGHDQKQAIGPLAGRAGRCRASRLRTPPCRWAGGTGKRAAPEGRRRRVSDHVGAVTVIPSARRVPLLGRNTMHSTRYL